MFRFVMPRESLALAFFLALASIPAQAEEADEMQALLRMSVRELSSEVVTARRRPEMLQQVPMAVTQINAEMLRDFQVNGLADLQGLVPNIIAHEGDASNAVIYLRGVGQVESLFFADPGVGVYLDDVYLGTPQAANLGLLDLERIEVLRGPQGTLYGKNTIGGAVKYVTRPLSGQREARLEASLGNYRQKNLTGVIAGTLAGDNLFGRFAFSSATRNGFASNDFNGAGDWDKSSLAWRASLKWQAKRDVSFQLTVDGYRNDPHAARSPNLATALTDGLGRTFLPQNDPSRVNTDYSQKNRTDSLGITGTLNWAINDALSLKSITAWRKLDYDSRVDIDASPVPLTDVWYQLKQRQFSQEVQLAFAKDKWSGVAGVYYYQEDGSAFDGVDMTSFLPPLWGFGGTASVYSQKTRSYAAYGEATYQWTERLSLTAGLRYTKERKKFNRDFELYAAGDLPAPGSGITFHPGSFPGGTGPFAMQKSWASLSPKIGLTYQWAENLLTYGSISSGFKSGGFDGRAQFAPGPLNQPFNPETLVSYEFGLKSRLFNNRLLFNASLFHNDYRDIQLSTVTENAGLFQPVFINAGRGVSRGLEIELTAKPTDKFLIRGSIGLMDSYFKQFIGRSGNVAGVDISSMRHFTFAPKLNLTLAAVFNHTLPDHGFLRVGADVRYRHGVYTTTSSSMVVYQRDVATLNSFVSLETLDRKWLFALAGKNLTNRKYIQHAFDGTVSTANGFQVKYCGEPRTYTLSATYRF